VAGHPDRVTTGSGTDFLSRQVTGILFSAGDHDGSARSGERFDHRPTQTTRGSRHDSHVSCQVEQFAWIFHRH
jgi:hypothetical protein